jgi:hypothetical protein
VGNAFFGLREIELGSGWQATVAKWLARLLTLSTDESIGFGDIRDLLQVQELLLRRMQELQPKTSRSLSNAEMRYLRLAEEALAGRADISLSGNEFLNGFESDLVIRVASDGGLSTIINVELDGPHHKYDLSKRRFCALRDQLLQEQHGVRVVRWDLMARSQQHKSDNDIIADCQRPLQGRSGRAVGCSA